MPIFLIIPLVILVSLLYFAATTAAIVYMKHDYFIKPRITTPVKETHKWAWLFMKLVKNVIGIFFVFAGIVMFFTPGQGLLTLLIGLCFMDFPGKRKLEIYLVRKPAIHNSINRLRKIANKPPIKIP